MLVKPREARRAGSGQFPASSQAITTPKETSLPSWFVFPKYRRVFSLELHSAAQLSRQLWAGREPHTNLLVWREARPLQGRVKNLPTSGCPICKDKSCAGTLLS